MAVLLLLLTTLVRALPRRHRFGAVRALARASTLPARLLRPVRHMQDRSLRPPEEALLYLLLVEMDRSGVEVDFEISYETAGALDGALAAGRGVLLIGVHAFLAVFPVRRLHDSGFPVTALTVSDQPHLRPGSRGVVPRIAQTPTFLIEARAALRDRRVVFAMLDHRLPLPGLTSPVKVGAKTLHLSDALVALAVRCGAPVVFLTARSTRTGIACTLAAPDPASPGSAGAVMDDFVSFLREQARDPAPRRPRPAALAH